MRNMQLKLKQSFVSEKLRIKKQEVYCKSLLKILSLNLKLRIDIHLSESPNIITSVVMIDELSVRVEV